MKEKLKKISIRALYILFALFVSIALWLFVEITENEVLTKDVVITEFTINNKELLDSRGLLVSEISTEEIVLTFEGSRADIGGLSSETVGLEVDLENIRAAGTFTLAYTEILPNDVNANAVSVINRSSSSIVVIIDRLGRKEFPVEVNYTGGTASNDFIADPAEIEPRFITISGPEEIVSRIAHVNVPIQASGLFTTYTDDLEFVLVDDTDKIIDSNLFEIGTLTSSHDTINVSIPIKQMKELPLNVELSHGVTTSDINTTWFSDPQVITVAGDPDAIRDIGNSITIGTIDMTIFALSTSRVFPIILPNHITNLSGETQATVMIEVLNLQRDYRNVSNFSTVNVPVGYTATVIDQTLLVTIRGTEDDLELIKPENIWVVADLTDFSPGSARVSAKAYINGIDATVDIVGEYSIAVRLTEDTP